MHLRTRHVVALILCASFASATRKPSGCDYTAHKLTVDTSNGPIRGHTANNTGCVIEYLGIPYAKPLVGDLRLAPPQRFVATDAYEAAEFGFDCPLTASKPVDYPGFTPQAQRIISYFASAAGTPQSEDCLTLNIWTKATVNANKADKPVLVFFYGGRFTIGNTHSPFYNATEPHPSTKHETDGSGSNYRLNVFGFPGAPGGPQNLGLRDQRAAVEWSSGGVSVDYWAYAYREDPIAHGIIAHSGNAFSFSQNTRSVQEANWNTVVSAVNCSSVADTMACMRKVDWQAIESAAAAIKPSKSTSVLRSIPAFWPTPDNDIVFSDYVGLTAKGSLAKLPILFGSTHNENGYYQIPAFAQGITPTEDQISSFLFESFICPVAYQATARRNHSVPPYAYRYFADWDNTRLYTTSDAYPGVDLHMVFGASADVSGLPNTADHRQLTKLMQKAWFCFSDGPSSGLSFKLGWPLYDPNGNTLIQLGLGNVPEAQFTYPSVYGSPCSTVTMGALGTAAAGNVV
ncbi:cholinesterase precursor [Achaetomium macrosporum]|uniref:Cholinesterase n=1 Tax=Achaetomium macrosporum TaxID=79813 RepID=A0AAN7C9U1_9PEZI|nr:cholinesterase precursor [Achaetomium macrosporum]